MIQEANEIEVTEAMIEAGVEALCSCDFAADAYREIVLEVYRSMEQVKARQIR